MEAVRRLRALLRERSEDIAWSIAGGLMGAGIGLLFSMLWLWSR